MIKKSQKLKQAIAESARELLSKKLPEKRLPGNFNGFSLRMTDPKDLPAEPIEFAEYGLNPKDFDCNQETCFLVVDNLMGERDGD